MSPNVYSIDDLLRVMERLRDPDTGCPWDVGQDFASIVPSTLEECYELAEAIEQQDFPHVAEELGDVLFQVIFYAQMGREQGLFSFDVIVDTLVNKLIRRHPHVFAGGNIEGVVQGDSSVEEVKESWERIKKSERAAKALNGVLEDVPLALPALPRAQKLQKCAALQGFDWTEVEEVLAKLEEEIAELRQAMIQGVEAEITAEMGDVLFSCVNVSRHLGLDAEEVLRLASGRFEHRFHAMEVAAARSGESLERLGAAELELLWEAAKVQKG